MLTGATAASVIGGAGAVTVFGSEGGGNTVSLGSGSALYVAGAGADTVVAGSGEAPEGKGSYREHTVALGDTSPAGLRQKAQYVLGEMERRMAALGFDWSASTAAQVYSVHDIHPFLADEIAKRGAMKGGLTWQFCRPPVVDLEYEMDCRGVAIERVV